MSNWVNGYIIPYGSKEDIQKITDYINNKEEWKNVINRNCPSPEYMKENEIHIYDNSAADAIKIAETIEEEFRDSIFHFFVCDEMNGIGWGINYMDCIETTILYKETHNDEGDYWLEPTKIDSKQITDEYIKERAIEEEKEILPF